MLLQFTRLQAVSFSKSKSRVARATLPLARATKGVKNHEEIPDAKISGTSPSVQIA